MKTRIAMFVSAMLLAGCSPFNTVMLYRDNTPFDGFMADRNACVAEAHKCIAARYANSSYNGETVEKLFPSRPAYLACMWSRGYEPVVSNGFMAPVLVKMTDYPPGRDCR